MPTAWAGEIDGDVAAEMAISALKKIREGGVNGQEPLVTAVSAANKAVMSRVLNNSDLVGMGTTVTAVLVNTGKAHWSTWATAGYIWCAAAN